MTGCQKLCKRHIERQNCQSGDRSTPTCGRLTHFSKKKLLTLFSTAESAMESGYNLHFSVHICREESACLVCSELVSAPSIKWLIDKCTGTGGQHWSWDGKNAEQFPSYSCIKKRRWQQLELLNTNFHFAGSIPSFGQDHPKLSR